MFSVYGRLGRIFRGSMEDLQKVRPLAPLARTARVAGPEAPSYGDGQLPEHAVLHRQAVAAYAHSVTARPPRHPLTRVADIMVYQVLSLSENSSVGQAWLQLAEHGFGQAPVLRDDGQVVGLLSRADLMRPDRLPGPGSHALVWKALQELPVHELMTSPVPCVEVDTDIRRLARVLLDTALPGLPVAGEDGRLAGFVSRSDILRAVVADPPLDLWS